MMNTKLFDGITQKFHTKLGEDGKIEYPFRTIISTNGPPSPSGWISSELPPVADAGILHSKVDGDREEFMRAVLDATTKSYEWLTSAGIKKIDEIPEYLRPYIIWGDLMRIVEETPNLSERVRNTFREELLKYKEELWDIRNTYTIQHALWAAGYLNHSVLDILWDWRERPRGRKFEMKSRLEKDLPIVRTTHTPDLLRKPYAEVVTRRDISKGGSGYLYLFPWHYEEGPYRTNTLVFGSASSAWKQLKYYIFG